MTLFSALLVLSLGASQVPIAPTVDTPIRVETQPMSGKRASTKHAAVVRIPGALHVLRASVSANGRVQMECRDGMALKSLDFRRISVKRAETGS